MKIIDGSGIIPETYLFSTADVSNVSAEILLQDASAEWSETLRTAAASARGSSSTLWVGPYGAALGGLVPPAVIGGAPWMKEAAPSSWDALRAAALDQLSFATEIEFMRTWARDRAYINRCFQTPGAVSSGKPSTAQDPTGIFAALAVGFSGANYYFAGQVIPALVAQFLPIPADYSGIFGTSYALVTTGSAEGAGADWANASFYTGTNGPAPGYMRVSCRYWDQLSVDTTSSKLFAIDVKKEALGFHPMGPLTGLHIAISQTTGSSALSAGTPRRYRVGACLVAHSVTGLGITGGQSYYFKSVNDLANYGGQYTDELPADSTAGGGIRAGLGTLRWGKDDYLAGRWALTSPLAGMAEVADASNPFAFAGVRKYTGRLLHAFPRAGATAVALMGPVAQREDGDLLVDSRFIGFDWSPSALQGLLSTDEGRELDLNGRRVWTAVGRSEISSRARAFYDTYAGSLALENGVDIEDEIVFPESPEHELPSMTVKQANEATAGKKYRQLHFVYGTPDEFERARYFVRIVVGKVNNACAITSVKVTGPQGVVTTVTPDNAAAVEVLNRALDEGCALSFGTADAAACPANVETIEPLFEIVYGRPFEQTEASEPAVAARKMAAPLEWDETHLYALKPAIYTGVSHKRGYAEIINFARDRTKLGTITSAMVFFARRGTERLKRVLKSKGLPT